VSSSILEEVICIGETGEYINGIGFKESDWDGFGLPIIRIQNLTNEEKSFNFTSRDVEDKYHIKNGDILVSWSATLGAFIWRRGPALLNQHIFKVVPRREIVRPKFLYYQLKYIIDSMSRSEHAHGSTMKHINRKPFLAHPFWRPRLEHQETVGQMLDKLFSDLDEAERTLQKIQVKLKKARASILKAAVEGRLDCGPEAQRKTPTTEALIEQVIGWEQQIAELGIRRGRKRRADSSFTTKLLATAGDDQGWLNVAVADVADVQLGRQRSPKNHSGDWMTPYLRAANITWFGLALEDVKSMNFAPEERERFTLHDGDILLNEASGSASEVGKPVMWRGEIEQCCFQNTLLRVRTIPSLRKWLLIHFMADAKSGRFSRSSKGVGIHHLSANTLSAHEIKIPPSALQDLIVAEVERCFSVLDQVESTVQASLARCVLLRQAILKRAFEGRLVPAPG
jgi:type I restriction enzyme S subunit